VLVTPRVIVSAEEEEKKAPDATAVKHGYQWLQGLCPASHFAEMADACVVQAGGTCAPMGAEKCPKEPCRARVMAELLRAYHEACAAGRADEAAKLARAALTIDPTCFHGKR
jgi:hypothetical protein